MAKTAPRPPGDPSALRPEIAASWLRATVAGLTPASPVNGEHFGDFDRRSRLRLAATPVLDELRTQLEGTTLCLLLADHECRIVDHRYTDRLVGAALEQVGVVPGVGFTENVSGTNSVATAFETRDSVFVNGGEHYLESLKKFSCFGHPIRHPVTRRIEGVLDITGIMPNADPLFAPIIRRAVRDIELRLLDSSARRERHLLAAFRSAAVSRSRAVVVLAEDVVLSNRPAIDLLTRADHVLLSSLAPDVSPGTPVKREVKLTSGEHVSAQLERLEGVPGTLVRLVPTTADLPLRASPRSAPENPSVNGRLAQLAGTRSPVSISGEPGSGRTTAVRTLAHEAEIVILDATTVASIGERAWARQLESLRTNHEGLLAVEDVQLLPARLTALLSRLMVSAKPRMVLTSAPRNTLSGDTASLVGTCVSAVDLPPLRKRREELPEIVQTMLSEIGADKSVRLTPSALSLLAGHHWPGNLRELRIVLQHAAKSRTAGDITSADLPIESQNGSSLRTLTAWEQAERDAIVAALRATGGNKRQAAERLGISRNTLYRRIRSLGITVAN